MNANVSEDVIARLLRAKRIAVVGLSDEPGRASGMIGKFLIAQGRDVVPVNPKYDEVFGLTCYRTLHDVPGKIDLVNVFRRAEFCPQIVRDAIAIHADGVWLQSGIVSEEAEQLAAAAGLPFVQDRCLMVEMARHR